MARNARPDPERYGCPSGPEYAAEACDDGNADDTDLCLSTCELASCGDGLVQPGEACDDGNKSNASLAKHL